MTSGFPDGDNLGSSSFDDFLARVYGTAGGFRPVRPLDLTGLMSEAARARPGGHRRRGRRPAGFHR
jgi:hypothetical protein